MKYLIAFSISLLLAGCGTTSKSISHTSSSQDVLNADSTDAIPKATSLDALQAQLEEQQKMIATMNQAQQEKLDALLEEQEQLKEQLKRQKINVTLIANADANAGKSKVATASTAYFAFFEQTSDFAALEDLAVKDVTVIPNREQTLAINVQEDAKFVGIKVGLRYTKQRSQFLLPIDSINFDEPLTLMVGACDVRIASGILPDASPDFADKLNYYQQPLTRCL